MKEIEKTWHVKIRKRKSPDIRHYHLKYVAGGIREILDILTY